MKGPWTDKESLSICLVAVGVYINTLGHGFVYDDNRAILANPDVLGLSSLFSVFQNDFWGTPLKSTSSHGSYRPISVLTFRLNHWLTGSRPGGYHAANVALHAAACCLVLHTARALRFPGRAPLLAAALFAVHPVHVEAVAGVVGRADILASVFFLMSFLHYVKHVKVRDSVLVQEETTRNTKPAGKMSGSLSRKQKDSSVVFSSRTKLLHELTIIPKRERINFILFLVFAVCSLLSKEPGITVIPLAICYDIILHLRSRSVMPRSHVLSSIIACAVSFTCILVVRLFIMSSLSPSFSKADNPTAKETSIVTRTLTFLYLPVFNFLLLLFPKWLSFDWSMNAIPKISSVFDFRFFLTIVFYSFLYVVLSTAVLRLAKKKRQKTEHNLLQCNVLSKDSAEDHVTACKIANNNNLPIIHCSCFKQRTETLPLESNVIMCLAFVSLPFVPASNLFFYVGFVVAERILYIPSIGYCLLVGLSAQRLWSSGNRSLVVGGSVILLIAFAGWTLQRNKDWNCEEDLYRSAIHINPPKAYANLGSVLSTSGRLEEAEVALRLSLDHRPNMADVHYNLGNLLNRQKRYNEAIDSYKQAIHYRPSLAVAYLNLGSVLETFDQWEESIAEYTKCIRLETSGLKDPRSHEDARVSCYQRLRRACDVRDCQEETKKAMQEMYDKGWLRLRFESTALTSDGRSHTSNERPASNKTKATKEEELFYRAIQKSPNDPTVYLSYGQLLVRQGRVEEAAGLYLKAALLRPDHYNVVSSAAIALRQAGRLREAERLYRRARDLRPADAASHSNLGAILHLQSKYREAASSYREALRLAPEDKITLTNLQKLRNILQTTKNKR